MVTNDTRSYEEGKMYNSNASLIYGISNDLKIWKKNLTGNDENKRIILYSTVILMCVYNIIIYYLLYWTYKIEINISRQFRSADDIAIVISI